MMKKNYFQLGRFWLILAIQIILFSFTYAQDSGKPDLLVAPLPELLFSESGLSIGSATQWEDIRRSELLELFREHVYGRIPLSDLSIVHCLVFEDREALEGRAIQKEVVLEVCKDADTLEISVLNKNVFRPSAIVTG